VITKVDDVPVKDSRDLARKIGEVAPGSTIHLTVVRDGREQRLDLSVRSYPSEKVTMNDDSGKVRPTFGMMLAPSDQVADARANGVVVVGVNPSGTASEKGVQQGDVIVDIGGKSVTQPHDVQSAVREAEKEGKSAVLLHMKTAEGGRFVALPLKQG
jgi:serine protease Do